MENPMFRSMRKKKRQLAQEQAIVLLKKGTTGVLACLGDEGYPYAIPLNYVYYKDKIYFHTAKEGHKIDAILNNPKVSFALEGADEIVSAEYTTHYSSVIAFGRARIAEGEERVEAFRALNERLAGDRPEEEREKAINECTSAYIIAIDIEHMTGKAHEECR